ncbi:WBSCR22 [Bugula neritina]|uniref:18S rRNA (guanine-N(7))-methyltransferase n=1 Tax=Bugula neritina TaxID=10212 RepID=A0A7J7K320_BUGNE|nr:WBSCR22 [Bugula neritina]
MASSSRRPEHTAPPEIFYNEKEARKYADSTRMMNIQSDLTERAIELLALPEDTPAYLLDVGCGSGLSGDKITDHGHYWVGVDISQSMLDVAVESQVVGDLMLSDMGQGMPFRAGTFDGCVSISALQWLCNVDKKTHKPGKRMATFFTTLYSCLARGARAVFQLYPENSQQLEFITQQAMKSGFTGGLVIDYPHSSKAKKIYLCLFTGGAPPALPRALGTGQTTEDRSVQYENRRTRTRGGKERKPLKKSKQWILDKKERGRRQGKDVRADSKYTGRRRKGKF